MVYIPREENLSSTKCSRILACIFHPVCYTMFVIFTSKLLSYTYCSDILFLTIRVRSTAASFGSLLHVMKARRPSCSFVKMFMAIGHDSWIAFLPRNCIIILEICKFCLITSQETFKEDLYGPRILEMHAQTHNWM